MNKNIYKNIMVKLLASTDKFLLNDSSLSNEIKEDFETIIEDCDITTWKSNIDGNIKGVNDLLFELDVSIRDHDKQKCIESIAMLRCAIADIASAFSNTMDSMEKLVVTIRDEESK